MKKIFLSVALVLAAGLGFTFAQSNKTTDHYLQASFKESFSTAKDISWKQAKNYDEVTFTMDGHVLSAFYKDNHRLIAMSRNISSAQLPLTLLGDLKRNYNEYWITDLFELAIDGRTEYYITLENAEKKKVMKSEAAAGWVDYNPLASAGI